MATNSDRDEYLQMVDDHGAAVLAMLRRLCGNTPDAEDVFQETAVRVWKSFDRRPPLRNPRAWLMAIAYRAFVDQLGRRCRGDVLIDVADDRQLSPGDVALKVEEATQIGTAVEELPEKLRQVVVLHYNFTPETSSEGVSRSWSGLRRAKIPDVKFDADDFFASANRADHALHGQTRSPGLDLISRGGAVVVNIAN